MKRFIFSIFLCSLVVTPMTFAASLKPISVDAPTLSKKQLNAPKAMYAVLSQSLALTKTEFETTVEFESRKARKAAELDPLSHYAVEFDAKVEYDADRGGYVASICNSLFAKSSASNIRKVRCDLAGVIVSKNSEYTAGNAYGFVTDVDKSYKEELSFRPSNIEEMLADTTHFIHEKDYGGHSFRIRIPFDRNIARANSKDDIRAVAIVQIAPAILEEEEYRKRATFDLPWDSTTKTFIFSAKIKQIWLVSIKTGKIISKNVIKA